MASETFFSTKTFKDFPCVHRAWRAQSHCRFFHGYSRSFFLEFASQKLSSEEWVMDFGGLKSVRKWLKYYFDHTFLVAQDDPILERCREWEKEGVIQLRVLPGVGMERTAEFVYAHVNKIIKEETEGRVWVTKVEVWENENNSAIFVPLN